MAGRKINNQSLKGNPSDFLLDAGATDNTSAVFSVTTIPKRIVAFGLTGDEKVHINRLLLPKGSIKRNECGEFIGREPLAEQPYYVGCNPVVLCSKQPEIVIDAFGDYRAVYEGDNREQIFLIEETDPVVKVENNMRGIELCCKENK